MRRILPAALALAAFGAVLCQLDPGGADPGMPQGPGLTVDEGLYTQQSVYLAAAPKIYGLALLDPRSLGEVFDPANNYLPDHPPLGKLWLGVWHDLAWAAHAPESPGGPFSVARARVGSAAAFALTVGLLVWCGGRWFGTAAGLAAGCSLILMPRVWGHAHLASLETVTNLFFTACLCGVAAWWDPRTVGLKRPAWCGVLLGLALLCKVQGALLVPAVAAWAAWHAGRTHGWRGAWRAVGPAAVFGGVGTLVFFAGWPYLWLNPGGNVPAFAATILDRAPVRNYYLWTVWNGPNLDPTPWHYPLVMTLATVPVGLTVLAAWGAVGGGRRGAGGRCGVEGEKTPGESPPAPPPFHLSPDPFHPLADPRASLMLSAVLVPLALVCTRGASLYDGVRLWLVVFPPLALLCGIGAARLYGKLEAWRPKLAGPAVIGLLAAQGVNVVWMSPVWLSSYSLAVGGLWGADRLGFERNYWGDAVTRGFLAEADAALPPGAPIRVVPTLHQFQERDLSAASPAVAARWRAWRRSIADRVERGLLDEPLLPGSAVVLRVGGGVGGAVTYEEKPVGSLREALRSDDPALLAALGRLPEDPLDPRLEKIAAGLANARRFGLATPPIPRPTVAFHRRAALGVDEPLVPHARRTGPPVEFAVTRFGVPLAAFSTAPLEPPPEPEGEDTGLDLF